MSREAMKLAMDYLLSKQIGAHIITALREALAEQPAQRKPLTDEEIILIVADCASSHQHTDIHFARAIEAKLKDKNNG